MKIKIVLLFLSLSSFISNAQITSLGNAINKAGKQRMLSQRMAKNYLAIGAGVKVEDALKELDESATTFNENYNDLMIYVKDKNSKEALEKVRVLWTEYRSKILSQPTIKNSALVVSEANNLTAACNNVVTEIVNNSNVKTAVLPNICGKQRMLSQKLAMLYMVNFLKLDYPNLEKEIAEARESFETNLEMLLRSDYNTDEIKSILRLQKDEWQFLKKAYDLKSNNTVPSYVLSSANLMTKNFDRTTFLYESIVN
jgi:hypothetical protein